MDSSDGAPADFNEDDFVHYNPFPYRGGYDIAATYGQPLPPSPSICYPIDDSPPTPPPLPSPPPSSPPQRSPKEPVYANGIGASEASQEPTPTRDYYPLDAWGYGCGLGHRRPCSADLFGCGNGNEILIQCAADYLFGYLPVYGEKRHESHHYGNLNYAYERHSYTQPISVQVDPDGLRSGWSLEPVYNEVVSVNQEQAYPQPKRPVYEYESGCEYEKPPWWSVDYPVSGHQEQDYPQPERSVYAYESGYGHGYEKPISAEVQPSFWSGELSYSDEFQEKVYPRTEFGIAYAKHNYEQSVSVQVEPVEQTWSHGVNFFDNYWEQVCHRSGSVNGHESNCYEQPPSPHIEPFEPAWSRDSRYYNLYNEAHSQIKHEDSQEYAAQSYCLFPKYAGYDY